MRAKDVPIEPTAELRELANFQRQYHAALIAEGFTEVQALAILGQWLAAAIASNKQDDDS